MMQSRKKSTTSTMVGYEHRDFCLDAGDVASSWLIAFTIVLILPSWFGG